MTKLSEAARAMGRKGGKSKSAKKLAACRKNAKKAGRPRLPESKLKPQSLRARKMRDKRITPTG